MTVVAGPEGLFEIERGILAFWKRDAGTFG